MLNNSLKYEIEYEYKFSFKCKRVQQTENNINF